MQVGTLDKAYRILDLYNESSESFSFSEIVGFTGLEKSSVQRLLSSLVQLGLMRKHERYKRYSLSPRFISFAVSFCLSDPLLHAAALHLEPLARQTTEAVSVGLMDGVHVFYVTRIVAGTHLPGALATRSFTILPVRQYAYCTAVGRAIMSRLPEVDIDRILAASPRRKFTELTIVEAAAIKRMLPEFRATGLAWQDGEVLDDELGLAAPILGDNDFPVGAVVMSIKKVNWDLESARKKFGSMIQLAARNMSSGSLAALRTHDGLTRPQPAKRAAAVREGGP
ncbi:MAG TPA: IclR family transcriptional regulator C-terminal domain-containing protein [Acetobacteraceae bacterium]